MNAGMANTMPMSGNTSAMTEITTNVQMYLRVFSVER